MPSAEATRERVVREVRGLPPLQAGDEIHWKIDKIIQEGIAEGDFAQSMLKFAEALELLSRLFAQTWELLPDEVQKTYLNFIPLFLGKVRTELRTQLDSSSFETYEKLVRQYRDKVLSAAIENERKFQFNLDDLNPSSAEGKAIHRIANLDNN